MSLNLMGESAPEDPSVIPMFPGDLEITMKQIGHRKFCEARCRHILVDRHKRRLECKHCGQEVDPFDYIYEWALAGDQRMRALKEVSIECKIRGEELKALKKEVESARRKLRKDDPEALKKLDDEHRTRRWNPHMIAPVHQATKGER